MFYKFIIEPLFFIEDIKNFYIKTKKKTNYPYITKNIL